MFRRSKKASDTRPVFIFRYSEVADMIAVISDMNPDDYYHSDTDMYVLITKCQAAVLANKITLRVVQD